MSFKLLSEKANANWEIAWKIAFLVTKSYQIVYLVDNCSNFEVNPLLHFQQIGLPVSIVPSCPKAYIGYHPLSLQNQVILKGNQWGVIKVINLTPSNSFAHQHPSLCILNCQ